jgi:hypothetical protein
MRERRLCRGPARAARAAFISGMQISLEAGALVALAGALLALTRLPLQTRSQQRINQRALRPVRSSDQHPLAKAQNSGRRNWT